MMRGRKFVGCRSKDPRKHKARAIKFVQDESLFTDIQMPGSMDGLKLAAAVRDRWPPIKIVATSGHVKVSADDLPQGGRFLRKPYSPAEIMKTLSELIEA